MPSTAPLESRLAAMLNLGTWSAFCVITAGLAAFVLQLGTVGEAVMLAGITLLVALPVVRVIVMLHHFYLARERRFVGLCALVLLILTVSVAVGLSLRTTS